MPTRSTCRREWQSTPISLPGEFHGQRSLAGCSWWGRKESDTTERLTHTGVLQIFHGAWLIVGKWETRVTWTETEEGMRPCRWQAGSLAAGSLFFIFLSPGWQPSVFQEWSATCCLVDALNCSLSPVQVLSHNLCTVLKVPHDPVALEEHFRDDDEGPVSNQGYMPYLNKFILEKVWV